MTAASVISRALLVATLLAGTALACGPRSDAPARTGKHHVRVAYSPYVSWGPLMIADAEGFFRDEGLEVEFVLSGHSEESLVALISGDIDVRPGPPSAGLLSAVAQGAPIRITAGMGYLAREACTYFGIVRRRGLDTVGAPSIKRLRTSQDGYTRFLVDRMLTAQHLSLDHIETMRLPSAVMVDALRRGAVDAIAASEPVLSHVATAGIRWISAQDVAPDFQWGVIAFGERLRSREPEVGIAFLRAYRRGIAQFSMGKTARNVAIISKAIGDTTQATQQACWPMFREDARINWASLDAFQRWARGVELLDRLVTEGEIWDSTFVTASDPRR